jgi:hypothetical protein
MSSDPYDPRAQLLLADQLVRAGQHSEAIAVYHRVAVHYFRLGFALKAIAIAKTTVSVADTFSLSSRALPAHRLLAETCRQLGLDADAAAAEKRCRELNPSS